jgi:hypothetical protein
MKDETKNLLISDIGRDVLAVIAPQELPLFPPISRAYFADPAGALKKRRSKDSALGFGADSMAILLTPVVLHILSEVFDVLAEAAKKALADGVAKEAPEAMRAMRAMLKRFHLQGPTIPSPLTRPQLMVIQEKISRAARDLQLPDDKVEALTNAVTAQLVISE